MTLFIIWMVIWIIISYIVIFKTDVPYLLFQNKQIPKNIWFSFKEDYMKSKKFWFAFRISFMIGPFGYIFLLFKNKKFK